MSPGKPVRQDHTYPAPKALGKQVVRRYARTEKGLFRPFFIQWPWLVIGIFRDKVGHRKLILLPLEIEIRRFVRYADEPASDSGRVLIKPGGKQGLGHISMGIGL